MPAANAPTETYVVRAGDWLAQIAEEHNSTVSSSWACQTANKGANDSEGANLSGSLAKAMADHLGQHGTNVEVFGFGRRSNYGPTWSNPNFGKEEKLDGHLWQDVGADNPVKVGDTSTNGIMSDKMWRFKHGSPVAAGVPRLR